ncbi:hypothetical protein [Bacillus sp. REN10]|uniref:hypothetical protein n=1 Tax=Bacillus sp. REN10 TaxID=2782541 RepID=UPI00193C50D6|nr:hypothetical protein [Bacillus sp. REN10]
MKTDELLRLRTHQFLIFNISISGFFLVIFFMSTADVKQAVFFLLVACILFFQAGFISLKKSPSFYFLSTKMRRLMEYEKGKLESEWGKQHRLQLTLQLLLGLVFLLYAFTFWGTDVKVGFDGSLLSTVSTYLSISLLINISLFFQTRKIDISSNNTRKGYTNHMIKVCGLACLISTCLSFAIFFFYS